MSSEYTTLVQGLETQIARSLSRTGQYRRWQQHTGGTPQRNGVPHSLEP